MSKVFQTKLFSTAGVLLLLGLGSLPAQDAADQNEIPLFVPIVPGQPSPLLPVPRGPPPPVLGGAGGGRPSGGSPSSFCSHRNSSTRHPVRPGNF